LYDLDLLFSTDWTSMMAVFGIFVFGICRSKYSGFVASSRGEIEKSEAGAHPAAI